MRTRAHPKMLAATILIRATCTTRFTAAGDSVMSESSGPPPSRGVGSLAGLRGCEGTAEWQRKGSRAMAHTLFVFASR